MTVHLFELLAALAIVSINLGFLLLGESIANRRQGHNSISFLLKWNSIRVLGLMLAIASVLFANNVNQASFALIFIGFYFCTIFYRLYRYGAAR